MESSNTGSNRKPGTFTKGDSRINRKGRPKSFDQLRKLAQEIAHEELQAGNGAKMTTTEAILRKWATSKDARLQMEFMATAYGKVPTVTEITGTKENDGEIRVRQIDYRAIVADPAE